MYVYSSYFTCMLITLHTRFLIVLTHVNLYLSLEHTDHEVLHIIVGCIISGFLSLILEIILGVLGKRLWSRKCPCKCITLNTIAIRTLLYDTVCIP